MKELETFRDGPNRAEALASFHAELIELRAQFEPGDTGTAEFTVRGTKLIHDAAQGGRVRTG